MTRWRPALLTCRGLLARTAALVLAVTGGLAMAQSPLAPEPGVGELQLAWRSRHGDILTAVLDVRGHALLHPQRALRDDQRVPLGSLWKLVAYARLADDAPPESDYVCRGRLKDEVYCCNAGERIDRGTALWRSCGLYFQPERVGWASRPMGPTLEALPASLQDLRDPRHLSSRQSVPLADWLHWLAAWPAASQRAAQDDLLGYWLQGPGRDQLGAVGSRLRLKTFTLERQDRGADNERWAGASGWLSDGRPLWLAARGSSKHVLPQWAPLVLRYIDQTEPRPDLIPHPQAPCIDVHYLSRYPVAQMRDAHGQGVAPSASARPLPRGVYRLMLAKGNTLDIVSDQDLSWQRDDSGQNLLRGRLTLDDYVARVIDREGAPEPAAAARALAIAARTYVLAHGQPQGGCLQIDDSSARQRVAPRPASDAARRISQDTAGLVLQGSVGLYHHERARPGVMAWTQAVQQAQAGLGFDAILSQAYPGVTLSSLSEPQGQQCAALPQAQAWLERQLPRWRRQLQGQAGYTPVTQLQVCRLELGLPHAQQASRRVFVRGVQSLDERLTLAHEYLHLAFSGHPRGTQEGFIESQARALLGVD